MTDAPETAPAVDVAAQHARYDRHADDRARLFEAVTSVLPRSATVLYAGSFIDIGPFAYLFRRSTHGSRRSPAAPPAGAAGARAPRAPRALARHAGSAYAGL